jgi:hypothetical protein
VTEFFVPDVTGENVMGVARVGATLDGRRPGGTFDRATVERSLQQSTEIARRSMLAAEQLGLIKKGDDGSYTFTGDADLRHAKRGDLSAFFGKHLLAFPPFLIFVTELSREYSPEDAAAFTVGVLGIQSKPELALKVLKGWGLYCDLLKVEGGVLTPTFQPMKLLDFGFIKRLADAMQSDAQVRTFVVNELGPELVADMSKRGVGDLPVAIADALVKHEKEPRRIGDPVGSMVEAYCSALMPTPVASNSLPDLARKLEDHGVILTPHRLLLNGVAGVRHPASHGVDMKTQKPWGVTSRGSLIGQLLALVALRSIFLWMQSQRQEV